MPAELTRKGTMIRTFLVIDVGSSAIKGVLFDAEGRSLRRTERQLPPSGGPEPLDVPSSELLHMVAAVNRELLAGQTQPEAAVLTGQMGSHVWVEDRMSWSDVMSWHDRRDYEEQQEMLGRVDPAAFYALTGQRVPLLAARAEWGRRRRGGFVVPLREWLIWLACEKWVIDPTDASVTGVLNVSKPDWDQDLADLFQIEDRSLLPVAGCNTVAGDVGQSGAQLLGMPIGTPIVLGAGDGPSASLGASAVEPTTGCLTLGSSGTLRVLSPWPAHDPSRRSTVLSFLPNAWVTSIPMNSVGFTLRWGQRALGFPDVESFSAAAARGKTDPSLTFVPYLKGERFPYWDSTLTAGFVGLRDDHDRHDLAKAIVLGLAYSVRRAIDHARSLGLPLGTINVNGGAAFCSPLLSAVQSLAQLQLRVTTSAALEGAFSILASQNEFGVTARAPSFSAVAAVEDTSGLLETGYAYFLARSLP
jgi:sugar (pentulose or hexulose) kinase